MPSMTLNRGSLPLVERGSDSTFLQYQSSFWASLTSAIVGIFLGGRASEDVSKRLLELHLLSHRGWFRRRRCGRSHRMCGLPISSRHLLRCPLFANYYTLMPCMYFTRTCSLFCCSLGCFCPLFSRRSPQWSAR